MIDLPARALRHIVYIGKRGLASLSINLRSGFFSWLDLNMLIDSSSNSYRLEDLQLLSLSFTRTIKTSKSEIGEPYLARFTGIYFHGGENLLGKKLSSLAAVVLRLATPRAFILELLLEPTGSIEIVKFQPVAKSIHQEAYEGENSRNSTHAPNFIYKFRRWLVLVFAREMILGGIFCDCSR